MTDAPPILTTLWAPDEDACPDCDGEGGTNACRCHGGGLQAEGCPFAVWTDCPSCNGGEQ